MKREELLKKIKQRVRRTQKMRKDPRYKRVLGFLTQIGFLHTNYEVTHVGNIRIPLRDAIWAGKEIEPRILEVLPAAFARLPKRFNYTDGEAEELKNIAQLFKENQLNGPDFMGIPYEKLKIWYHLPLQDRRTKTPEQKKITRTFRLKPEVIDQLESQAKAKNISMAELIEKLVTFQPLI